VAAAAAAVQIMPSFGEQGSTTALEIITNSSVASTTLKSFIENPLKFEKAAVNVATGLNGRFTPLNRPVSLENGMANGIHNGVATTDKSSASPSKGSAAASKDQDDHPPVNGEEKSTTTDVEERISTEWLRILHRPPGLKNYSNTCYMNSTLQAVMHIPPLVFYLLDGTHGSICTISRRSSLTIGGKNSRTCILCRIERHARESYSFQRSNFIEPQGIIGKGGGPHLLSLHC
jgi:hypothetical protein